MSEIKNKIEFKMLDYERVGSDFVAFKLDDGALVKVKVDLDRVGIATNHKNPDGTPHYAINTSVKIAVIPNDRKFSVDKNPKQTSSPPSQMFS